MARRAAAVGDGGAAMMDATLDDALTLLFDALSAPRQEVESKLDLEGPTETLDGFVSLDTGDAVISFGVASEDGVVALAVLVGEAHPDIQVGSPTLRWTDAQEAARSWSERIAARDGVRLWDDRGSKWRLVDCGRPGDPVLVNLGPSFPVGEWTSETRALHVVGYLIDRADSPCPPREVGR